MDKQDKWNLFHLIFTIVACVISWIFLVHLVPSWMSATDGDRPFLAAVIGADVVIAVGSTLQLSAVVGAMIAVIREIGISDEIPDDDELRQFLDENVSKEAKVVIANVYLVGLVAGILTALLLILSTKW